MNPRQEKKYFQDNLLAWYISSRRNLSWRQNRDPYRVWLSEIIMQQTRVEQGTPYYERMIAQWPTVNELAKATEDEVLRQWQGLGYYSRARNLHHTAKTIANHFGGNFPDDYKLLLALKGVGRYTAAAIMSIAFQKPFPAVDGNVMRVLSRIYLVSEPINSAPSVKIFYSLAEDIIPKAEPGLFNEAMMELGAMICTPKQPKCSECPVKEICRAAATKEQALYPVKIAKQKVKIIRIHYLAALSGGKILIRKRVNAGIWRGLYDLPAIMNEKSDDLEKSNPENIPGLEIVKLRHVDEVWHRLTHRLLHISFYSAEIKILPGQAEFLFVSENEIISYPLPKPVENFIHKFFLSPNKKANLACNI